MQSNVRQKILAGVSVSVSVLSSISAQEVTKEPNIIIIMADQLRVDLLQREGYPLNTMPFADNLAKNGTWFDCAYTSAPASGPARVSMLTGRFPSATHVKSNHNIKDAYYTKDLFDVAKEKGYTTAMVGKNHSHLTADRVDYWSPYNHGGQESRNKSEKGKAFDRYLGTLDMYASMEPSPYGVEAQLPYRMVDDACHWIDSHKDKPFLMWFSIAEPHNPYQVCEPYYSMFPPESLPEMGSSAKDLNTKGEEYQLLAEMMAPFQNDYSCQLEEIHHIHKLDAPSGTAISIAEGIFKHSDFKSWKLDETQGTELGITAIREGEVPGTHSVFYRSEVDEIEIKHTAFNRNGFAVGAVIAAEWLPGKVGNFGMKQVLGL